MSYDIIYDMIWTHVSLCNVTSCLDITIVSTIDLLVLCRYKNDGLLTSHIVYTLFKSWFHNAVLRIRAGLETMCIEHLKDDYFVLHAHPMEDITRHLLQFNDEWPGDITRQETPCRCPIHKGDTLFIFSSLVFAFLAVKLWGPALRIAGTCGVLASSPIPNTWAPCWGVFKAAKHRQGWSWFANKSFD